MAKQTIEDSIWKSRLKAADTYYDKWDQMFKCDILEKYYEGNQWKAMLDINYRPYVINKIYETIQIKIDQFVPQFPKFNISPTPGNSSWDLEDAAASAQLKEDVLNTIVWDEHEHFHEELEQAYKDSFFRFGIIEVGYASDWIWNPNAPKPLLDSDVKQNTNRAKPKIKSEPDELPINERVFFKQIAAKRFRVGGIDNKYLEQCTWCGYFEWVPKADLLALKGIMNRDKIQISSFNVPESGVYDKNNKEFNDGHNVKIWHIWHNKAKKRLILLDAPCVTIFERGFKRLPLFDFRPDRRVSDEGFYPIPPVYHWLSPQDEINETREGLRKHRRRFIRKFQVGEGAIDDDEVQKWEEGDDGTLIKIKGQGNGIQPILDAPLDNANKDAITTSADDLNQISGTSAEVRGVADRTTATQANIITQKASVRENADRDRMANWLIRIGRETLLVVREKFVLGVWAKLTTTNEESLGQEVQENLPAYKWVTSEQLNDGYDFRIILDVTSLSADSQQVEEQKFVAFLSIVTQFPQIAMSPILIQEAAYRVGYRNQKAIRELQKMALMHQLQIQMQAQQQGLGQGGGGQQPQGNPIAQQQVANRTPPMVERVRNQIGRQLQPQPGRTM